MNDTDPTDAEDLKAETSEPTPMERLRSQLLQRWRQFPSDLSRTLDGELKDALERASAAEPEVLTITSPVSRPSRLRLAVLASDNSLDTMYRQERAELAVSDRGCVYLVYRPRGGGDYGIEWSPSTTIPGTMMPNLSEALAAAMFESDE